MRRIGYLAFVLAMVVACLAILPYSANACGDERWPVKVVQDKHRKYFYKDRDVAGGILVEPVATTVVKLATQPWPFSWSVGAIPDQWSYRYRHGQAEFTLWRVSATLLKKKDEADEDYHLVLKSGSRKMIAEIPSENCIANTPDPIRGMIIQARSDFDAWYDAQPNKDHLNTKVRLTGMGYFDRVHGNAEGQVKKNGIEIHPVIKIEFLN